MRLLAAGARIALPYPIDSSLRRVQTSSIPNIERYYHDACRASMGPGGRLRFSAATQCAATSASTNPHKRTAGRGKSTPTPPKPPRNTTPHPPPGQVHPRRVGRSRPTPGSTAGGACLLRSRAHRSQRLTTGVYLAKPGNRRLDLALWPVPYAGITQIRFRGRQRNSVYPLSPASRAPHVLRTTRTELLLRTTASFTTVGLHVKSHMVSAIFIPGILHALRIAGFL